MVVLSVGHPCCESGFMLLTLQCVRNHDFSGEGFLFYHVISRSTMQRINGENVYDLTRSEQITIFRSTEYSIVR